jgi:hypothetical protein
MHYTHLILDEKYVPVGGVEVDFFKENQTFMYAGLEDHLKTDKGISFAVMCKDSTVISRSMHWVRLQLSCQVTRYCYTLQRHDAQ